MLLHLITGTYLLELMNLNSHFMFLCFDVGAILMLLLQLLKSILCVCSMTCSVVYPSFTEWWTGLILRLAVQMHWRSDIYL